MSDRPPTVSVVTPFLDPGPFLAEAVESLFVQDFPDWELLLVDDGSGEESSREARGYAARDPDRVRYLEHEGHGNRGISASLNLGLRHARGEYFAWLDADDVWLPGKLAQQVVLLRRFPDVAMAFGRTQFWYSWTGRPQDRWSDVVPSLGVRRNSAIEPPQMLERILRGSAPAPCTCSTLMRRSALDAVGGFEERFAKNHADQAIYAKLFLEHRTLAWESCWSRYRRHPRSATWRMKRAGRADAARLDFLSWLSDYLARRGIRPAAVREALDGEIVRRRGAESKPLRRIAGSVLPEPARAGLRRFRARLAGATPPGLVRWGDLRRLKPFSRRWGLDRGLPIDRYYIEGFLARHNTDIRGRVLEIGDDAYAWRFGGLSVTATDVFDAREESPDATYTGDLACADEVPSDRFDCIVFTQTLQFFFEPSRAIRTLHRILKPSGVLLATLPGISPVGRPADWGETWYWGFTTVSARRLFGEAFPDSSCRVEARGNVLAATGFLQGLAAQELTVRELDWDDPAYPVSILVRAVKPAAEASAS